MADTTNPTQPAPAAPKKSPVSRMADAVGSHAYLSLAIIVVLTIVVVVGHIYNHGLLFLGPYADKKTKAGKKTEKAAASETDAETERLIDSINNS